MGAGFDAASFTLFFEAATGAFEATLGRSADLGVALADFFFFAFAGAERAALEPLKFLAFALTDFTDFFDTFFAIGL